MMIDKGSAIGADSHLDFSSTVLSSHSISASSRSLFNNLRAKTVEERKGERGSKWLVHVFLFVGATTALLRIRAN